MGLLDFQADMPDPPKLQHYAPQHYLVGFADPDNPKTIWVYEKGREAPRQQGIKNTAAETYYYSITLPDGQVDHFLESDFLTPIENAAIAVLDRLRTERAAEVGAPDLEPLASYLAVFFARSPRTRRTVEKMFLGASTAVAKKEMQNEAGIRRFLDANPDIPLSVEDVSRLVREIDDPQKWKLEVAKDPLVALQFSGVARFFPHFLNKSYCVLTCSGDPEFITCDSPLSVFAANKTGRALVGVGIGLRQAEIVLPLSPYRAIRLRGGPQPARQRVSDRLVRDINRRLVYQADRYVFASRQSKRIAAFASRWFRDRDDLALDPEAMRRFADRLTRTREGDG